MPTVVGLGGQHSVVPPHREQLDLLSGHDVVATGVANPPEDQPDADLTSLP